MPTSGASMSTLQRAIGPVQATAMVVGTIIGASIFVQPAVITAHVSSVGAVHRHIAKLADAGINVTAADAVAAGNGRYGMILWVKPKDYARAARALNARS